MHFHNEMAIFYIYPFCWNQHGDPLNLHIYLYTFLKILELILQAMGKKTYMLCKKAELVSALNLRILFSNVNISLSKCGKRLFELWCVKIKLCLTFHPQINGQIELANQILEQYLWHKSFINWIFFSMT